MAAITASRTAKSAGRHVEIWYGTSAANSSDTLTTSSDTSNASAIRRFLYATCTYSGSPTQAGVSFTLDSGLGAAYDATLSTGTANATTTVYIPTSDVLLMPTDNIIVSAPAGGGSLTSSIVIVLERIS